MIDIDKFITSLLHQRRFLSDNENGYIIAALKEQGLEFRDGSIKDILEDAVVDSNEDGLIAETIKYKNEKQGEKKPADSYCQENCKGFQETGKCFADGECKAKREAEQELQLKEGKYYECVKSYHYIGCGQYWFDKGSVYFCEKDGYLRSDPNNLIKVYDCKNWQSYFRPYTENPAWSEEDKGIIEEVVSYLINYSNIVESKEDADRIEYLIDKIQDICPHQKQEWSEEDEQHIDSLLKRLDALCRNKFERTRFAISEDRDWLKSLRPQKCLIPSEEEIEKAAQEWDSKANFNPFYMTMENGKPTGVKQSITTHKESFKVGVNWILRFLKGKVKPQWKPTDKQMNVLWCHCSEGSILKSLYDDLKKLKEE